MCLNDSTLQSLCLLVLSPVFPDEKAYEHDDDRPECDCHLAERQADSDKVFSGKRVRHHFSSLGLRFRSGDFCDFNVSPIGTQRSKISMQSMQL